MNGFMLNLVALSFFSQVEVGQIFDPRSPLEFKALQAGTADPNLVSFGPKFLAIVGSNPSVPLPLSGGLFKIEDSSLKRSGFLVTKNSSVLTGVKALALSTDGKIAVVDHNGILSIWNKPDPLKSEDRLIPDFTSKLPSQTSNVTWCDGTYLTAACGSLIVTLAQKQDGSWIEFNSFDTGSELVAVRWISNQKLVTLGKDGAALSWTRSGNSNFVREKIAHFKLDATALLPAKIHQINDDIILFSLDTKIEVLSRKKISRNIIECGSPIVSLTVHEELVFVALKDRTICCWNIKTLKKVGCLVINEEATSITASNDNLHLAVVTTSGFLKIYKLND